MNATHASYSLATVPSSNERFAAAIAHAGPIISWTLAPLLVYLLKRDDSRYAEFHSLQALLWSVFGTIVSALTCGVAIPVFLAFHLYAAWKVFHGEEYEYPLVGDFARGWMKAR